MCLELIISAVSAIATIIIAIIAYIGLDRWQKEINGRANFDLARALLGTVYHLRDEITRCRHPFLAAHEFPEDYNPVSSNPHNQLMAERHVYHNRLKSVHDAWKEFNTCASEAEVLWEDELKENVEEIFKCVIKLNTSANTWLNNKPHFEKNPSEGEKYKSVFMAAADDEFSSRIGKAIKNIEIKLRPYLSDY